MNFYENLKSVCESKGLKVTPTVLQCGGTKGVISGWKRGVFPNSEIVMQLSVLLSVPCDTLLFGSSKSPLSTISTDEQELLSLFNKLSVKDQQRIIGRTAQLAELAQESKKIVKPKPALIPLYYIDNSVSAGIGESLNDYEQRETVYVEDTPQNRKADFILPVSGDSMEPKFYDGDLVLVRQQQAVNDGEIGIFDIDGKGYMKKFAVDRLISLNPKYDDIVFNNYTDVKCFGLVLGTTEILEN